MAILEDSFAFPSEYFGSRVTTLREHAPLAERDYVLYWMSAARRTRYNFGLQRALEWAQQLGKPLLVIEALRVGYQHASERFHAFVIEGMRANAAAFDRAGVRYHAWIEREDGQGKGLLKALSDQACVAVCDTWPCFFLPNATKAFAEQASCRVESVDSTCILPLSASPKAFSRAYDYRRFMQKNLSRFLDEWPIESPLQTYQAPPPAAVPEAILKRWPMLDDAFLRGGDQALDGLLHELPIDHQVKRVPSKPGGMAAAQAQLAGFIKQRYPRYADDRSHPDRDAASGLSPWLHFGHLSPHDVFDQICAVEGWSSVDCAEKATGQRSGWWGASEAWEAFMDELISWREVGHYFSHHRHEDYDRYEGLPEWAKRSLAEHADDPRQLYTFEELEGARTDDPIWNAAQRQLVRDGIIHNALRMLWGKKVLGWTESPQQAFEWLVKLNDRWALDGRDPNSYSGIGWVLGRFDRAWGPERPIFGKIRYMTSESSARKWKLKAWLEEYGPQGQLF